MFKVASFNCNSVRARLDIILNWLESEKPDILCLQETKVEDQHFPTGGFNSVGYNVIFTGQKSYNGVAIASPHDITGITHDITGFCRPGEARLIEAQIKGINVVNTYMPQGRAPNTEEFAYKINWIKSMRHYFAQHYRPDMMLLWTGDFNVALEPIDVYAPDKLLGQVGYHPDEHEALHYVKEWGLEDIFRRHVKEAGQYTFWDYRVPNGIKRKMGWRIDHIWATQCLASLSRCACVDMGPRLMEKPSDHTFIVAEFDL
ncbi:MAG: exodeoxyribonuclease III [Desulfotomaculaceae bacterium]|nr:exodeoxyribonuclease III [Desulfotomaculaceae bacterium]